MPMGSIRAGPRTSNGYTTPLAPRREHGGTTTIRVPIIPISLDLLAPDGSVLVHVDANHDVPPTLNSPLFQNAPYSSSSTPTQFNDAIQRAEFASKAKSDWHTLLQPVVEPGVTLEMPWGSFGYAVWASGPQAGQIAYVLLDGATVDNLMFPTTYSWPPDTQLRSWGRLEASGEITTHDITTFLLPDTFELGDAFHLRRISRLGYGAGRRQQRQPPALLPRTSRRPGSLPSLSLGPRHRHRGHLRAQPRAERDAQ